MTDLRCSSEGRARLLRAGPPAFFGEAVGEVSSSSPEEDEALFPGDLMERPESRGSAGTLEERDGEGGESAIMSSSSSRSSCSAGEIGCSFERRAGIASGSMDDRLALLGGVMGGGVGGLRVRGV